MRIHLTAAFVLGELTQMVSARELDAVAGECSRRASSVHLIRSDCVRAAAGKGVSGAKQCGKPEEWPTHIAKLCAAAPVDLSGELTEFDQVAIVITHRSNAREELLAHFFFEGNDGVILLDNSFHGTRMELSMSTAR